MCQCVELADVKGQLVNIRTNKYDVHSFYGCAHMIFRLHEQFQMIKFSKEKVLLLHQLIAQETGGSIGVQAEGVLESALETAFSDFGDQEFYHTKEEKGAWLGYSLISNHAFVDGNKRIGVYVMLTFLEENGIRLDCTNEDIVKIGLGVADGSMDYEALLAWVREHRV